MYKYIEYVGDLFRRRVPVIRQIKDNECAAACVTMILAHYRRSVNLDQASELCGTGPQGATALGIIQVARFFGLSGRGFLLEPAKFEQVRLPAIVHWNSCHFVVLERWSPKRARIVDPFLGRRRLTSEEFNARFTGVILSFDLCPGPSRHS